MRTNLPLPHQEAILFEDEKLYACLANYPLSEGHSVIVWKGDIKDLHLLHRSDYLHLMEHVEILRNALMKTLDVEKVYLIYMDESNQVHWHLVPRYNEKGYNLLTHEPEILTDFSLTEKIKSNLKPIKK